MPLKSFRPSKKEFIAKFLPNVETDFRSKKLKGFTPNEKDKYIKTTLKELDKKIKENYFYVSQYNKKLLRQYNKEGLPDLRSKEWQLLTKEEKEDYINLQVEIAKQNRDDEKNLKDYIGDIKYNIIYYDLMSVRVKIRNQNPIKKINIQKIKEEYNINKEEEEDIYNEYINILVEKWKERCIKYEENINNRIYEENIDKSFYKILIDEIKKERKKEDEKKNITTLFNDKYNLEIQDSNKTSLKDGYNKWYYFKNSYIYSFDIKKINKNKINDYLKAFIINQLYIYTDEYGNEDNLIFLTKDYIFNYEIFENKVNKYEEIKMKDANNYNLEDYENQEWDTKNGRCVFDYIINKYGNLKGLKLICNDEELIKIFDDEEALINGVNTYQITNFCMKFNIPLYAYDDNDNLFYHYYPNKKNNYPCMMFKILNNHFYPIPEKLRRNYINKKLGLNINSSIYINDTEIIDNDKKKK